MPSVTHDILNLLFRDNPGFAVEVLRDHLGVDLPTGLPVAVVGNDFNDRPSQDFHADTVITLGSQHELAHGIIVEIQQDYKESKREAWPRYAAALWLRLRRPVTVLVVCLDPKVAAWAAEPIITDLPGYTLTPQVFSLDQVPAITEPDEAAEHLELAVLSVKMYGTDRKVAEAFMAGLPRAKERRHRKHASQYYEWAYRLSSGDVRLILEELMRSTPWLVASPFAKEHYGKGVKEGEAKGEARGEARGEAKAVLAVLQERGITVSEAVRDRIATCTDLPQLDKWVRLAATVTCVDDLFVDQV